MLITEIFDTYLKGIDEVNLAALNKRDMFEVEGIIQGIAHKDVYPSYPKLSKNDEGENKIAFHFNLQTVRLTAIKSLWLNKGIFTLQ